MYEAREKMLLDLFGAIERLRGSVYECTYYPCHFAGQDCSLCFCPFYPCFIYRLGGELLITSAGEYVWSCKNCYWIHEKENVEDIVGYFSSYPRQMIVEADWLFFSRSLQNILFGQELGERYGEWYSLMEPNFYGMNCTTTEGGSFLAVKFDSEMRIESVVKLTEINQIDAPEKSNAGSNAETETRLRETLKGILIPEKFNRRLRGFIGEKFVECRI
jgi:hypothetical protein